MPCAERTFCIPLLPCAFEKRLYLTAEQLAAKYMLTHYRSSIVSCAPTRPCGDHVFHSLGALLSSRRFPESSILSCCSYLVVDAIHLCDGQRPDGLVRPPALCSQYKAGGCAKSAGFISGGDMKHVCADPFPHGLHTIYYCAASSAGCRAASCAARAFSFFAAIFAACSCRNRLS